MLPYLVGILLSELFHVTKGTLKRTTAILTWEQPGSCSLASLHCALTGCSLAALRSFYKCWWTPDGFVVLVRILWELI